MKRIRIADLIEILELADQDSCISSGELEAIIDDFVQGASRSEDLADSRTIRGEV